MEKKVATIPPRASSIPTTTKRVARPWRRPTLASVTSTQKIVPASEDEGVDLVDRNELEGAWLTIQDQENKLAGVKQRLQEVLGKEVDNEDLR